MTKMQEFFAKKVNAAKEYTGSVALGVALVALISPNVSSDDLLKFIPKSSVEITQEADDVIRNGATYMLRDIQQQKIIDEIKEIAHVNEQLAHSVISLSDLTDELVYLAEASQNLPVRDQVNIISKVASEWLHDIKRDLVLMDAKNEPIMASFLESGSQFDFEKETMELEKELRRLEKDKQDAWDEQDELATKVELLSKEIDTIIRVAAEPHSDEDIATDAFVRLVNLVEEYNLRRPSTETVDAIANLIEEMDNDYVSEYILN